MTLLNSVNCPGSDIEQYVKGVDKILQNKYDIISSLKSKLGVFQLHLKQEASISKKFNEMQQKQGNSPLEEVDLLRDEINLEDEFS